MSTGEFTIHYLHTCFSSMETATLSWHFQWLSSQKDQQTIQKEPKVYNTKGVQKENKAAGTQVCLQSAFFFSPQEA